MDEIDEAVVQMLPLPDGYEHIMSPEEWSEELRQCMRTHGCDWIHWFPHIVPLSQALRVAARPDLFVKKPTPAAEYVLKECMGCGQLIIVDSDNDTPMCANCD